MLRIPSRRDRGHRCDDRQDNVQPEDHQLESDDSVDQGPKGDIANPRKMVDGDPRPGKTGFR